MFRNIAVLCLLITFLLSYGCSDSGNETIELNEISIGALIPQSGDFASGGVEILAALNFAVTDINSVFESENKATRINLVYADTKTDSTTAKLHMESFISQDIRITIGPSTSMEVVGIKDQINSSNNIVISPSSTMPELAVAGDNIYRAVPDDSQMAEATVEVMWQQGIRNLALFYLDNRWSHSLTSLMKEKFEAKGGTFIGQVSYIGARESELREYLAGLSEMVSDFLSGANTSTTAIQMISLDVGSLLLELAYEDSTLGLVKWYGCDGYVNSNELFTYYPNGTAFAKTVEFTSPIFGSTSTAESIVLTERLTSMIDRTPSQFALVAYDALIAAAKVMDAVGEDASLSEIKENLISTCASLNGVTGNIIFNAAGDRDNGKYFFWKVVPEADSAKWEHVLTYNNGVIE
ncbi:MAG: ABC transporter substrate-binding protein [Bacteroidetes bacterium]|nr:ABC transporter substrate-binding protein [Bacteroidota bacterium]